MKLRVLKIVEIVAASIAGILVLVFGAIILQQIAYKNEPFSLLGVHIYEINEDSYNEPSKDLIDDGDLIICLKTKKYKENNIVLYKTGEKYNVKKVVSSENGKVTIRPLTQVTDVFDDELNNSDVLGKKLIVWQGYADFRTSLVSPTVIVILGVIFFGGFVTCFILEKVFTSKEDIRKN